MLGAAVEEPQASRGDAVDTAVAWLLNRGTHKARGSRRLVAVREAHSPAVVGKALVIGVPVVTLGQARTAAMATLQMTVRRTAGHRAAVAGITAEVVVAAATAFTTAQARAAAHRSSADCQRFP